MTNTAIRNSLIGLALGDSFGMDTEFIPFETLAQEKYNYFDLFAQRNGNQLEQLKVTDDTQLSIYVIEALKRIEDHSDNRQIIDSFNTAFIQWFDDPLNTLDRAPGNSCMESIRLMKSHTQSPFPNLKHDSYAIENSMGSGSIMRSGWIGLDAHIPEENLANIVQLQSEITHQNPLATGSSVIFAHLIRALRTKEIILDDALEYVYEQIKLYPEWNELNSFIQPIPQAIELMRSNYSDLYAYDPCSTLGGGWIAPETLALSLAIAPVYRNDPILALQRTLMTGGDSDTIGAVTGTLIGITHDEIIEEWNVYFDQLETHYKSQIDNSVYPYLVKPVDNRILL